jgi:hypothetical protein
MTELGQFAGEVSAPPIQPPESFIAPPPARPGRGWTAMLAVIAALFVVLTIATAAVVALGGKTAGQVDVDTPQGAVQSWATAIKAGDYTTADTYLSSNIRATGTTSSQLVMGLPVSDVTIGAPQTNGDSATLSVTIELSQSPTLTLAQNFDFKMVRESGGWKIDQMQGPLADSTK